MAVRKYSIFKISRKKNNIQILRVQRSCVQPKIYADLIDLCSRFCDANKILFENNEKEGNELVDAIHAAFPHSHQIYYILKLKFFWNYRQQPIPRRTGDFNSRISNESNKV